MQSLQLDLETLDRSTAEERLSPNQAAVAQWVDMSWRPGTIFRAFGSSRTQITNSSTTVTGNLAVRAQDGQMIMLDSNTAGTIRMTPGSSTARNAGPLNEWSDSRTVEP